MSNCCDKPQEMSFSITNTGLTDKVFRLFGGGTGLDSVVDNNYALSSGFIPVGDGPYTITYNPDLNYIYATNNSPLYPAVTPTISVIDSATNLVVNTISIPFGVFLTSMLYISDNKYLYITDNGSDKVYVIDTLTNTIAQTITVGNQPTGIIYVSDFGKIYVSNNTDGTISIINVATSLVLASPAVGASPQELAYASSSGKIYITNAGDGTVSVIDSSNSVTGTIIIGGVPAVNNIGILYVSSTDRLYVPHSGDNTVYVINPNTDTVSDTISVGLECASIVYNEFQNLLYCNNVGDYTISVINAGTNAVDSLITLTSSIFGASQLSVFNTTNQYLYVSLSFSNVVQVFDTQNSNSLVQTFSSGIINPFNIVFNTSNTVYVCNNGDDNIFYSSTEPAVSITVNGGQSTITEVNNNTLANPLCICSMVFTGTDKDIFNNLLYKNFLSSSGIRNRIIYRCE